MVSRNRNQRGRIHHLTERTFLALKRTHRRHISSVYNGIFIGELLLFMLCAYQRRILKTEQKINRYQLHVDKRSRGMIEMYVQFDYTVNLYQMMELRGGFLECY